MSASIEDSKTITIYMHPRAKAYLERLVKIMKTSRSEIVEDMVKHIREEELEKDIWGSDWTDALEEFEESESESESEEKEEEEE